MKITIFCYLVVLLGLVQGKEKMSKDQIITVVQNMVPMVNKGVCAARKYKFK